MMWMSICQGIILVAVLARFLADLTRAIKGSPAKEATGLEAMSHEIPGVLFHLKGEGEEAGDIWDLFALDGKVQKHQAKIVRQNEPDPEAWGSK